MGLFQELQTWSACYNDCKIDVFHNYHNCELSGCQCYGETEKKCMNASQIKPSQTLVFLTTLRFFFLKKYYSDFCKPLLIYKSLIKVDFDQFFSRVFGQFYKGVDL